VFPGSLQAFAAPVPCISMPQPGWVQIVFARVSGKKLLRRLFQPCWKSRLFSMPAFKKCIVDLLLTQGISKFTVYILLEPGSSAFWGNATFIRHSTSKKTALVTSFYVLRINKIVSNVKGIVESSPLEPIAKIALLHRTTPAVINSQSHISVSYSFDRAVICDSAEIAQLLIANNFHNTLKINACSWKILFGWSSTRYFPTVVWRMLRLETLTWYMWWLRMLALEV
jgi:hypothetical protein